MDEVLPTQFSSRSQTMSTADENGNEKFKEIIPWEFVPYDVRFQLIVRLNPTACISGNDWRMLACGFGCTPAQIDFFESENENNTKALFRYYDVKPGASFNEIYKILAEMDRKDCLAILDTAYAKIRQAYIEKQRSLRVHTGVIPDPHVNGGHNQRPNHSCPCTQAGHPTPVHWGHTYCPCGGTYTVCGCVDNSHLHLHSTDHSLLPHPHHQEITQPICTPIPASPGHTCSVHINVMNKSRAHFSPSGNVESSSTGTLGSPARSFLGHQPYVHTSNPGCQVDNFNVNVTGDSALKNINTSRDTERQKVNRQHSVNCNVMPDFNRDKRVRNNCGGSGLETNCQMGTCVAANNNGDKMGAPKHEVPNVNVRLNSPADHMDYTSRCVPDGKVKMDFLEDSSDEPSAMVSCHSSTRQPLGRNQFSATYPLMKKTIHDSSVEDSKYLILSKKASSVYADMKPKAFRKAFRNIQVFVTYSDDSDLHRTHVFTLCKFLQDNGFACFVDLTEDNSSGRYSMFMESCRQRMAKADYILVCISNKYLEEIAPDRSARQSSFKEYRLHAKEIYQLLNLKHLHPTAIAQSPCVIPLLFDKMTLNHIPKCMMGAPTYRWPEQYMNLALLLTKTRREDTDA